MKQDPSPAHRAVAHGAEPIGPVDVVVVGAGPSGLMTAMEIAASGVRVAVLEKRGEPALTRAGVLQPRVMEIFAMRGLADVVLRRAQEINGAKFRTSNGIWAGLPGIDYQLIKSDFPYIVVLSQIEIEAILANRCAALGVAIHRGVEVVGVDQDEYAATVRYRVEGREGAVPARYVVGADGARSVVRESIGAGWVGHEARNLAVNIDADIRFPFDDAVVVVNTERGWGLSYPLTEKLTRLAVIDAATMLGVGRQKTIDFPAALESLRRVFGDDYGVSTARISQFHDAMFRAQTLRVGRVLLVGESVRVHYPASGVGMNFCLQDATNLGWKIAATVQGWGPPRLLDSYETERGPEIDDLLDSVRAQTAVQFSFTSESLALKDLLIRRILPVPGVQKAIAEQLSGLSAHYGGGSGLVGSRVPNLPLADGRTLYDVIEACRYTLLAPSDRAAAPFVDGPHLVCVVGELPGAEDRLALVRPDGYVDAAGDQAAIAVRLREARLT